MKFLTFSKEEGPVDIKILPSTTPWPFTAYVDPKASFVPCPIFDCPMCWAAKEMRYAQHELDRWADDGGR